MIGGNTAIVDLIAQLINLTTEKEEIDLIALILIHLERLITLLLLSLFVCLDGHLIGIFEALLLEYQKIGCLVELINMVAKVFGRR